MLSHWARHSACTGPMVAICSNHSGDSQQRYTIIVPNAGLYIWTIGLGMICCTDVLINGKDLAEFLCNKCGESGRGLGQYNAGGELAVREYMSGI